MQLDEPAFAQPELARAHTMPLLGQRPHTLEENQNLFWGVDHIDRMMGYGDLGDGEAWQEGIEHEARRKTSSHALFVQDLMDEPIEPLSKEEPKETEFFTPEDLNPAEQQISDLLPASNEVSVDENAGVILNDPLLEVVGTSIFR